MINMLLLAADESFNNILLLDECSLDGEWEGQVQYLPLQ